MKSITLAASFFVLLLFGCATETEKSAEEKAKDQIENAMNDLSESLKEGKDAANQSYTDALSEVSNALENLKGSGEVTEPVNFREIKKLLPERIGGLPLTNSEGATSGAMGFKVSNVDAVYSEGGKKVDVEIVDCGGIATVARGMAAWLTFEIDKESSRGFERTTTIDGNKAYEKCEGKYCEIALFVGDRFIVKVSGRDVEYESLRRALKDIDLDRLSRLVS